MNMENHKLLFSAAMAAIIRGVVPLLRSGLLNNVWDKAPKWSRPVMLIAIACILSVIDSIAVGLPMAQALLAGLSGLAVAITSYESGKAIKIPKEPKAP